MNSCKLLFFAVIVGLLCAAAAIYLVHSLKDDYPISPRGTIWTFYSVWSVTGVIYFVLELLVPSIASFF